MATVGEVVALLVTAIDGFDQSVVVADRARSDIRHAHDRLSRALGDTDHADGRQALADLIEAAARMDKFARLIAEAADRTAGYVQEIAPGAAPSRVATPNASPSGEDLVRDAVLGAESRATIDGFLRRTARNIENVQEKGQDVTKIIETAIKEIKNPAKPGGGHSTTGTASPTAPTKIDASDAVGNLIVVGVVLGIAAQRSGKIIRQAIVRLRKRERGGEGKRLDPGDGA